jgi:hypothetical protein
VPFSFSFSHADTVVKKRLAFFCGTIFSLQMKANENGRNVYHAFLFELLANNSLMPISIPICSSNDDSVIGQTNNQIIRRLNDSDSAILFTRLFAVLALIIELEAGS